MATETVRKRNDDDNHKNDIKKRKKLYAMHAGKRKTRMEVNLNGEMIHVRC